MLGRLAEAERMTLDHYREDLAHREKVRACYAELEADWDACISLSAPAAAPLGLDSTGDPNCTVHASLLGIPAISLPVLQDDGLPRVADHRFRQRRRPGLRRRGRHPAVVPSMSAHIRRFGFRGCALRIKIRCSSTKIP